MSTSVDRMAIYCELQDLIDESEYNSVEFEAVFGRYTTEELVAELAKRKGAV